eukprot:scaffold13234_cov36-Tisochrysis_lutea.AAC.1
MGAPRERENTTHSPQGDQDTTGGSKTPWQPSGRGGKKVGEHRLLGARGGSKSTTVLSLPPTPEAASTRGEAAKQDEESGRGKGRGSRVECRAARMAFLPQLAPRVTCVRSA